MQSIFIRKPNFWTKHCQTLVQFPSLVANSTLSTTTDLESSEKKVAVIGAGVSGISALRNLTWPIGNIKPVAFERSPTFGGHWSFTNDTLPDQFGYPSSSAIYSGLRTNLPKELMTFPGFEHDSTLPTFPTQDDIFYYLRRYIDHCDLEKYMKFNIIVTNAVPKHPGDFKTKWEVAYCHVHEPMNTTTEDFDAVIVCSGNCVFPNVPPFPGLKNFTGRLLHSRNYRNAQEFRGQKVAVVGSSYSGKDVARQLSDVADKVYIVHIDQPLNTIYPNGNVIEKNFGVQSITNSSLVLANGEEIEIDCLIFCTGYRYRFPFLSEDILSIDDEHVSPLYKHILHLEYHSLMVITLLRNIATFPLSFSMGQFARAVIDGKANLPHKLNMKQDIASEVHWRRDNKLVGPHWHYMDTLQWDFDRSLARIGKFDPLPEILQIYWNFVESHRENDFINYWKYDYCMNENNTIVANKREVSSDFNFSPRKFLHSL